jgi:hypothetical protein
MALLKTIIKNSSKEVVIKTDGSNDSTTIYLTDLLSSDQVLGASGASDYSAPKCNIAAYAVSGWLNGAYTITRGGVNVITASPENAPAVQFNQLGFTDNINNNQALVVTHGGATGANMQSFIVLHKQEGFYSKVEYEKYGAYDDETKVGALNTSGSPDYTG